MRSIAAANPPTDWALDTFANKHGVDDAVGAPEVTLAKRMTKRNDHPRSNLQ
jgi:hypothetical protein